MISEINFTDDIDAGLDKLDRDIREKVLISGAAAMALVFYDEAKLQAAKHAKTYTLYNAIYRVHSETLSMPGRVVYQVSVNKAKAPHWAFLEFGTSRAPAYPYLRPAFAMAPIALQAGVTRMAERLQEVQGGAP